MDREKAIQISIFGVIFIISLILWNYFLVGRNNQGVKEMAQATLPMLTIEIGGEEINQLHGYSSSVDASMLRESLTPIEDSSFKVITTGSGSEAVSYKLYDTDNTTVIDSGDAAFKEEDKRYHATNEGLCSWYEFACEIFKKAGMDHVEVTPVTSGEFPVKAVRPSNSRMSKEKLTENGFERLPSWQDALERYLKLIEKE